MKQAIASKKIVALRPAQLPNSDNEGNVGEKRHYPRISCHFNVNLEKEKLSPATVEDFGLDGLRLRLRIPRSFTSHQLLTLTFNGAPFGKDVVLPCRVQWYQRLTETITVVGVQFAELGEWQSQLFKYVFVALENNIPINKINPLPLQLIKNRENLNIIVKNIQEIDLPHFFKALTTDIAKVTNRPLYLWKWCYSELQQTTLLAVDQDHKALVCNTKLLSIIFLTLVDDIADKCKNAALLSLALQIPFTHSSNTKDLPKHEKQYINLCRRIWNFVISNLHQFPRYSEFKDILDFDYDQLFTTMRHSLLINTKHFALNLSEAFLYQGYNMHIVINLMMDVMCSPTIHKSEIGFLRSIAIDAQMMCRIANWLATWERELQDLDFSSGIIACALEEGIVTTNTLDTLTRENVKTIIEKIRRSSVQEKLIYEWNTTYQKMRKKLETLTNGYYLSYLSGMERFFQSQLASQGLQ